MGVINDQLNKNARCLKSESTFAKIMSPVIQLPFVDPLNDGRERRQ